MLRRRQKRSAPGTKESEMDFSELLKQLQLSGYSGGYRPVFPQGQSEDFIQGPLIYSPSTLMTRLGIPLADQFELGITSQLMKFPDGRATHQLGPIELSYLTQMLGGDVKAKYSQGPFGNRQAMFTFQKQLRGLLD
jgi:hypothetical protein